MSKKTNNNTAELEDKIKNYGKEIKHLSDFVEKVRKTPDVYIGKVRGNTAFLTMVREIFQNSVDEILKGNAFSPVINVLWKWWRTRENPPDIHDRFSYRRRPYTCAEGSSRL